MSQEAPRDGDRDVRDLAADARRERRLIPQALVALLVVAAVVVLREMLLR
ncbi:hypothetical protein [uncultured Microbacterium sp.]|nr:hypothetical protein [uncultured Microbacterium sp.]